MTDVSADKCKDWISALMGLIKYIINRCNLLLEYRRDVFIIIHNHPLIRLKTNLGYKLKTDKSWGCTNSFNNI